MRSNNITMLDDLPDLEEFENQQNVMNTMNPNSSSRIIPNDMYNKFKGNIRNSYTVPRESGMISNYKPMFTPLPPNSYYNQQFQTMQPTTIQTIPSTTIQTMPSTTIQTVPIISSTPTTSIQNNPTFNSTPIKTVKNNQISKPIIEYMEPDQDNSNCDIKPYLIAIIVLIVIFILTLMYFINVLNKFINTLKIKL